MRILFVGGSWNKTGGKESGFISKFSSVLKEHEGCYVDVYNGGKYEQLRNLLYSVNSYNCVFWWANIPNTLPKLQSPKVIDPTIMLVGSKRNDDNKYTFSELISISLNRKQNLAVAVSKNKDNHFDFMLYDPLGNVWYSGSDITACAHVLVNRLFTISKITRIGSKLNADVINPPAVPNEAAYFDVIKKYAEIFRNITDPELETNRFLENSSFRCQKGFPSFRKGDVIFVSKRNVSREFVDRTGFVPVLFEKNDKIEYFGENKPSVDTPIQIELYKEFPNINYMIHAHVYIENAPFTNNVLPCGAFEEVEEILKIVEDRSKNFYIINLKGHGCIVMADSVEKFSDIEFTARPLPEYQII